MPPNFRRQLSARLRRLVSQEKLEKVQNGYRLQREVVNGTKGPIPKPKEIRPRLSGASSEFATGDTMFSSAMMLTTRTTVLSSEFATGDTVLCFWMSMVPDRYQPGKM
ncbi:hypothetical protein HanPSC8_Chr05g0205061 [Helianthus annuus]|nr:hypothetical protein HanPSC8_Chr05g0205061 [Helianthus annuus]